jgi:small GTP-binding protein
MFQVKLVLLGDTSVGKTAIVARACSGTRAGGISQTVGVSFATLTMGTPDGSSMVFSIWDTAGQEKYRQLVPMYFRGAQAAVLVYDLTQRSSYESLRGWCERLTQSAPECEIALVGNKSDLVLSDSDRCVTYK